MVTLSEGDIAIRVWIECDGKPLKEYDTTAKGNLQECWIASEEGKEFVIQIRSEDSPESNVDMDVLVDGVLIDSMHIAVKKGIRGDWSYTTSGYRLSDTELRPLLFAKLDLQENVLSSAPANSLKDLGTITVTMQRVRKPRKPTATQIVRDMRPVLPGDHPIDEKTKKAGGHAAKLGPAIHAPSEMLYEAFQASKPLRGAALNSAVFRYASMDYLQAREIIPSEPTLPPQPAQESNPAPTSTPTNPLPGSTSDVEVKREPENNTNGPSKKRTMSNVDDLGLSGDSDDMDELDPEDLAAIARVKEKLNNIRSRKNKKVKTEPVISNYIPGEVIVVSD